MKKLIKTKSVAFLFIVAAASFAMPAYALKDCIKANTCVKAPGGATITASAGNGEVTLAWSGITVERVVRFWLVEADPQTGGWQSAQNPPGKSATLGGVCSSNDKYNYDARFQMKSSSGKWLLITPEGVPGATLTGVHQECKGSSMGCALEVDESVLKQACSSAQ